MVIYCDDTYIKDMIEFLIKRKLSLHIILVSHNYSSIYQKGYYKGDIQSIYFIKLIKSGNMITIQRQQTNVCSAFEVNFDINSLNDN